MGDFLRVVDFGTLDPLRSQTVWHAVAEGVSAGAPPTLSFVRTRRPYVSIGFHRSVSEVDTDRCRSAGWPVYRRMAGGGPVYLDDRQLCFQVSLPARMVPASRPRALRFLLEPALEAFRAAGLDADLDPGLEIVVEDRKVCGHGAAQIGAAVVVVGNLIESFDHRAAASILTAPDAEEAGEVLRLMRRYVAWDGDGPAVDASAFIAAAREGYGRALGLSARAGGLDADERAALVRFDRRMRDPEWGGGAPATSSPVWRVKVRSGVWLCSVSYPEGKTAASIVGGRLEKLRVADEAVVDPDALDRKLRGMAVGDAARLVQGRGRGGARVAASLVQMGGLAG